MFTPSLLMQGLEKHGVGRWREIGEELLPQWDDQFLRIKTGRLFGSQSLARYVGWKGSKCVSIPTATSCHCLQLRTVSSAFKHAAACYCSALSPLAAADRLSHAANRDICLIAMFAEQCNPECVNDLWYPRICWASKSSKAS